MADKVGRPRIFETVDDLEQAVYDYFFPWVHEETTTKVGTFVSSEKKRGINKKPSVTGLSLSLGFADKTTLYEYRDRPEFSYPIKTALTMIEQYHEEGLCDNNVAGRIFALKNMGWKDKTETDLTGNLTLHQITGMTVT